MGYLGEPFPSELLTLVEEEYPPFGRLKKAHQQHLATMLWQFASPAYAHRSWPGASFSSQSQEALWGNRRTRNTYVGEYFSVIQGDNHSRKTGLRTQKIRLLERQFQPRRPVFQRGHDLAS